MKKQWITGPLLVALPLSAKAQQTIDVHSHIIVPEYVVILTCPMPY